MLTTILGIAGSAATIVAGIIAYRNRANRQRREAENDVAAKEAALKAKTDEIKEAVYTADDARLNKIVIGLLAPLFAILLTLVIMLGCASEPQTVYIPTDRRIESCTNSLGIACKAVPDAVMVEMLEKLQELKELKTELKVDKRLSK